MILGPALTEPAQKQLDAKIQVVIEFLLAATELLSFPVDVIATVVLDSFETIAKDDASAVSRIPRITLNARHLSPVATVRLLAITRSFEHLRQLALKNHYSRHNVALPLLTFSDVKLALDHEPSLFWIPELDVVDMPAPFLSSAWDNELHISPPTDLKSSLATVSHNNAMQP